MFDLLIPKYQNSLFNNLLKEVDDMFYDPFHRTSVKRNSEFVPSVDIKEDSDKFEIIVEIPGMDKSDIDISVKDNSLNIQGEKLSNKNNDFKGCHMNEISYGKFSRKFSLPDNIDKDDIEAVYEQGILKLVIPKVETKKDKKIKIEIR